VHQFLDHLGLVSELVFLRGNLILLLEQKLGAGPQRSETGTCSTRCLRKMATFCCGVKCLRVFSIGDLFQMPHSVARARLFQFRLKLDTSEGLNITWPEEENQWPQPFNYH
jgi:hypothetical protein